MSKVASQLVCAVTHKHSKSTPVAQAFAKTTKLWSVDENGITTYTLLTDGIKLADESFEQHTGLREALNCDIDRLREIQRSRSRDMKIPMHRAPAPLTEMGSDKNGDILYV